MTDPIHEPLDNYRKIIENLENLARKHGLYLQGAAIIPPKEEDGAVFLQGTFLVGEVAAEAVPADTGEWQDEFDAIISGAAKSEEEQRIEEIKREYQAGKGIFGDDE